MISKRLKYSTLQHQKYINQQLAILKITGKDDNNNCFLELENPNDIVLVENNSLICNVPVLIDLDERLDVYSEISVFKVSAFSSDIFWEDEENTYLGEEYTSIQGSAISNDEPVIYFNFTVYHESKEYSISFWGLYEKTIQGSFEDYDYYNSYDDWGFSITLENGYISMSRFLDSVYIYMDIEEVYINISRESGGIVIE